MFLKESNKCSAKSVSVKSDLTAKARILKLGKSLIVGDVLLYSKGTPNPVARASLTYSYKSNWGTIVP